MALSTRTAAAVQRRRLDLHDRVERFAPGLPQLERVRSEQGGAARLRTGVGVRAEGQEDPGERADARPGRHTGSGEGDGRADEGTVRIRDPAEKDGPP